MARTVAMCKESVSKHKTKKTRKKKKQKKTSQFTKRCRLTGTTVTWTNVAQSDEALPSPAQESRHHGANHKGLQVNKLDEKNMMNAITEFRQQSGKPEGDRLSVRAIARAWSVPYATFRKRVLGGVKNDARQGQHCSGRPTILSAQEEEDLASHLTNLAEVGFPCTREDVRRLAFQYAKRKGITGFSVKKSNAGYYWLLGFLRHIQTCQLIKQKAFLLPGQWV